MLLSLLVLGAAAKAATVNYNLFVGNADVSPDGFQRSAVVAGLTPQILTFPGPTLKATKGDVIKVTVHNQLTDPRMRRATSLHFNGINQNGHPEFDGQSFATQCPISQNHSFTYTIDTKDQAGSFFYRSAHSVQMADGLRGAVVIYDPADPNRDLYDVDDDSTIIQLGEWYEALSPEILANFTRDAFIPIYDAGLINSRGRTNANPNVPFEVFTVVPGRRYRYRLISTAPRAVMPFSVDGHNLTVIEVDGNAIQPVETENLELYPAQRVSVVFTANQPVGNYWVRSTLHGGLQTRNPNLNATFNKAIIRYVGAPIEDPADTPEVTRPLVVESQFHPIVNPGSPGGANATPAADVWLDFQTGITDTNPNNTWRINGTAYEAPTVPTLVQILDGNFTFPNSSHVMVLPENSLIQFTILLGEDGGGHPLHLHGTQFSVIKPGDSNVTNFIDPPRRDIDIDNVDTSMIRFRTGAAGIFHLNCSIMWHALIGLQMTFVVGLDTLRKTLKPSAEWSQLCAIYNALPDELK